jgi:glycerophosphoryl diester phosphodiesterase
LVRLFVSFLTLAIFSSLIRADVIVIAHRGANGYLPEHTLEAFKLAIQMGADYIEPDLVFSKDGILVVRHDNYLSTTTDVADHPEFVSRKRSIAGREDWFTEDFTLSELKTLRARQSFRGRSNRHDGKYLIPAFQEVIDLAKSESRRLGKSIGIYPETKLPAYFNRLGFDFAVILPVVLEANDLNTRQAAIFIQSFEPGVLHRIHETSDVRLIQLVSRARAGNKHARPGEPGIPLAEIKKYATGVGAEKSLLMTSAGEPTGFVQRAKALGLTVHAWTFRDDAYPTQLFDSAEEELGSFLQLGIDGFFTDFPDTGVRVRNVFAESQHVE